MPESLPSGRAGRRIAILLVRVGVSLSLSWGVEIRSPAQTPVPRDLTQFPDIHFVDHMLDQRSVFGKITWRF